MSNTTAPPNEGRFWAGIDFADAFFMHNSSVHRTLQKLAALLDAEHIAYAVAGAMALNEHGYRRVTTDVDVLITREGLAALKSVALGRGYLEKFPGSKGIRDTDENVLIDFLIAGEFPGDGLKKPVCFPDPAVVAIRGKSAAFLPLPKLLELKLASGMSAPHRLKDLSDVIETIRAIAVPRELGKELDPWVQAKFDELWVVAQAHDPISET